MLQLQLFQIHKVVQKVKQMNQLDITPLNYAAQDRAVTTTDYETLVQSIYPNALSVSAWGEDDETPRYGVVKIGVKAASGSTLTETTKADIVNKLKPYNVVCSHKLLVEVTSVLLSSTVKYDSKSTTKSSDTLKSEITTVTNYNTNTLQKFDAVYRHSKLTGLIDDVDTSILSNITTIKIRKNFTLYHHLQNMISTLETRYLIHILVIMQISRWYFKFNRFQSNR